MTCMENGVYVFYYGGLNQDVFFEGLDFSKLFNDNDSL